MNEDELDLIDTDVLMAALARRFDVLIVVGERKLNGRENEFFGQWFGGLTMAIGLASRYHTRLARLATEDGPDNKLDTN